MSIGLRRVVGRYKNPDNKADIESIRVKRWLVHINMICNLDAGKPMSDFNMEQQGDLVSHYFEAYFLQNESREKNGKIPRLPFLQNILSNFIRNPSDVTLLPSATKIEP